MFKRFMNTLQHVLDPYQQTVFFSFSPPAYDSCYDVFIRMANMPSSYFEQKIDF